MGRDAYLLLKGGPATSEVGEPAWSRLLNPDLQGVVSRLEILRTFSVLTPDLVLAEQIEEAAKDERKIITVEGLGWYARMQVVART